MLNPQAALLVLIINKKLSEWTHSLMFILGIIPSIATMLIWRIGIYGDDGIFNQLIGFFGGEKISFLHNTDYYRSSLLYGVFLPAVYCGAVAALNHRLSILVPFVCDTLRLEDAYFGYLLPMVDGMGAAIMA